MVCFFRVWHNSAPDRPVTVPVFAVSSKRYMPVHQNGKRPTLTSQPLVSHIIKNENWLSLPLDDEPETCGEEECGDADGDGEGERSVGALYC